MCSWSRGHYASASKWLEGVRRDVASGQSVAFMQPRIRLGMAWQILRLQAWSLHKSTPSKPFTDKNAQRQVLLLEVNSWRYPSVSPCLDSLASSVCSWCQVWVDLLLLWQATRSQAGACNRRVIWRAGVCLHVVRNFPVPVLSERTGQPSCSVR